MNNTGSFNSEHIKIEKITIVRAAIENKTQLLLLEKNIHFFDIQYNFVPGINIEKNKFRIIFTCQIDTYSKPQTILDLKGTFDIAYFFEVQELQNVAKVDEGDLSVDTDFIVCMCNIVYATSRGIIYTRCQGTILNEVILPVLPNINLVNMLQKQADKSVVKKKNVKKKIIKKK